MHFREVTRTNLHDWPMFHVRRSTQDTLVIIAQLDDSLEQFRGNTAWATRSVF